MPQQAISQKVCIVDEDTDVLTKLPPLLAKLGFTVRCYTTVSEFQDQEEMRDIACLLVEINLAENKSLALLSDLNTKDYRIPTIATSSKSDIGTAVDAMKQNVIDVLEKPLIYNLLVNQISSVVRVCSRRHSNNNA